jgi:Domain of unknown function (DUF4129)
MRRRKLWILILLAIAIVAILALSASVVELEFSPGDPFALGGGIAFKPPPGGLSSDASPMMMLIVRGALLLMVALIPFSIFYLIISPSARKKALQNLIIFGVFILIINLLRQQMRPGERADMFAGMNLGAPGQPGAQLPAAQFSGAAPDWLVILASFGLAILIAAITVGIIWAILKNRRKPQTSLSLERIADQADEARESIQAGGDLHDTIIRCYMEMNQIVREARGIQRQQAVTPSEFEGQLADAGLPREPVADLTHLFEDVRYGSKALGEWEGRRAITCLTAIADACRNLTHIPEPDAIDP